MKSAKWWMGLLAAGGAWMLAGTSVAMPQPRASETSGGVTWSYVAYQGTAVLTGASPAKGNLTIPSTLGGYPVATIADKTFYQCEELTGIVIPEGVTGILGSTFDGCSKLASVTFPSTLTSIGDAAFWGCRSLKAVDFPAGVTNIGANAFSECSSLERVVLPDNVETIWEVFYNCTNLVSVTLPANVKVIRHHAFYRCTRLASVTFPDGIEEICNDAFYGCTALTTVTIPASVTTIYNGFPECRGLTNAVILGADTDVSRAFSGCASLERIYVPASWEGTTKLDNSGLSYWTAVIYGEPGKELAVFDPNGGSCAMYSQSYELGKAYGMLPEAARTHYSFAGWWTAAEGGTHVTETSFASVEGKRTLYAHWTLVEQAVTFYGNGGLVVSGDTAVSSCSEVFVAGQAYGTLPAAKRAQYSFDGWYTAANGGELVLASDMVEGSDIRTLYAHWTLAEQVVTFYANGGTCDTPNRTYSVDGTYAPLPEATLEKYTFAGWWTSSSGGDRVLSTDAVTASETRTLYAHWIPIDQVVTFYANGGTCATPNRTYAVGGTYTPLPEATREHYAFSGWWTATNGGEQVLATDTVTERETRTLYAHWTLAEQVVTFDANGGSCDTTNHVYAVGQPYATLPEPIREHYIFSGWWTSSSGGEQVLATDTVTERETRTLYAHWSLTEQVVMFNANGGSCDITNLVYAIGQPYARLPEPTLEHYAFAGWYALMRNGWECIDETSVVTTERSRMLFAGWWEGGVPESVHVSGFPRDGEMGGFTVEFAGTAGKTYGLQRMRNLEGAASWATVGMLEADRSGTLSMAAKTPEGWDKGVFRVVELGSGLGLPEPYLVLDLSAGSGDGAVYPVSYLDSEPEEGWTGEYKTTKLVLRLIPGGTYTMGSPSGELGRRDDYETQHEVTISKPFYMGVFEVTQRQWELVMGSNPSALKGSMRPVEWVRYNDIRGISAGSGWPGSAEVDAASFLGRLQARTGGFAFDLPTEAQWEYACRAGTTTALNSGKDLTGTSSCTNMAEVGRYYYNNSSDDATWDGKGEYSSGHAVVGSYKPNAWGLYDMHGNVWEWCLDRWQSVLGSEAVTDPVGASAGSDRVWRGGGHGYAAASCRSANRASSYPSGTSGDLGFRLSMILSE